MNDIFSDLVGQIPLGRLTYIMEAEKFFMDMGYEEHMVSINNVIGGSPENTGSELAEAIEYCYYECLYSLTELFGIRLADDNHSLKDLLFICRAMHSITLPMNHDMVRGHIDLIQDTNELLATICASLEHPDMFWFLAKFDYVDGELINRIKDELNEVEDFEERDDLTIELAGIYKEHVNDSNKGIIANNTGYIPHLPVSFRGMFVSLQDKLSMVGPEQLAEEIYQLSLLANEKDLYEDNLAKVTKAFEKDMFFIATATKYAQGKGYV